MPASRPPGFQIPTLQVPEFRLPGVVRATRRGRLPFVIGGLIALGLVGAALLASPMVRPRLDALGRRVRQRIDEVRISSGEDAAERAGEGEPHAIDAAVAVPVDRSAFTDAAPDDGSPYDGPGALPDGQGADTGQVSESAEMLVGARFRPTV